jgi:hypothetical protein
MRSEFLRFEAVGAGVVADVVVGTAADECHVAGRELEWALWIIEPQPCSPSDDSMDRELDGARQSQSPRGPGHRPGEDGAGGTRPREVILEQVHVRRMVGETSSIIKAMSVWRKMLRVLRIDPIGIGSHH